MFEKVELLFRQPGKFLRLALERGDPRGKLHPVKRAEYGGRFATSLAEWIIYHQREILTKQVTWLGVPVWKNVLDLHMYQEIIFEQGPEFIVEIGSAYGGSTLYLAHVCDILGKGIVISVDISREHFGVRHPRIKVVTGDSTDAKTIAAVHELAGTGNAMVIQDGNHQKDAVLADLRNYADLIPLHGYFIVEDTIADVFHPGNGVGRLMEGPLCAVEQFLAENSEFMVDKSRERYLITQNPGGYLRRVQPAPQRTQI